MMVLWMAGQTADKMVAVLVVMMALWMAGLSAARKVDVKAVNLAKLKGKLLVDPSEYGSVAPKAG